MTKFRTLANRFEAEKFAGRVKELYSEAGDPFELSCEEGKGPGDFLGGEGDEMQCKGVTPYKDNEFFVRKLGDQEIDYGGEPITEEIFEVGADIEEQTVPDYGEVLQSEQFYYLERVRTSQFTERELALVKCGELKDLR